MKTLIRSLALAAALLTSGLQVSALDARPSHRAARHAAPKPVAKPQPAVPAARPAMWKVADADTTIYLFGTVHALPKGITWFDGAIATAFDQSQELVTEITDSDPAQMQAAVLARGTLPEGQTLRSLLTDKQRTDYEAALKTYNLPAESFDRLKPWYVAVFLSALPVLRDGYDPANGVEQALDARAKVLSRPHSALETVDYQLSLFDSLPQPTQLRYLAEVLETMPKARNELAAMVDAWKRGDADTLARLMNEDEDEPELKEKLLTQRNRAWADWIVTRLEKPGTVFIAVGAGHLAGAGSVQDQLAGKGLTSTRLQ